MPETKTTKKFRLRVLWRLCPVRLGILAASLLLTALYFLLRGNRTLMVFLCDKVVHPYHRAAARLLSFSEFSVGELLYLLLGAAVLVYLVWQVVCLIRKPEKAKRLFRTFVTLLGTVCTIYALFCALWGVYYYGESFSERMGLSAEPVAVEDLKSVTAYFVEIANETAACVERDEAGLFTADRREILRRSAAVYDEISEAYPCLAAENLQPKALRVSKLISLIQFTGFFFPFTGEANLNMNSPVCMLPVTAAHEIAHQRGAATEQEANFLGVAACLASGETDFTYSAALLAYIHLGNALYSADRTAWQEVSSALCESAWADLRANSAYWDAYETPVSEVSDTVYSGFLQSYGQTLGLRSYGACVDLLVACYSEAAKEAGF